MEVRLASNKQWQAGQKDEYNKFQCKLHLLWMFKINVTFIIKDQKTELMAEYSRTRSYWLLVQDDYL